MKGNTYTWQQADRQDGFDARPASACQHTTDNDMRNTNTYIKVRRLLGSALSFLACVSVTLCASMVSMEAVAAPVASAASAGAGLSTGAVVDYVVIKDGEDV